VPMTAEEKFECRVIPITSRGIKSIMNNWKREKRVEFNADEAINHLAEKFGEPVNGKEWSTINVFREDNLVAEWDAAHWSGWG